jgi:hypothetical protein
MGPFLRLINGLTTLIIPEKSAPFTSNALFIKEKCTNGGAFPFAPLLWFMQDKQYL